MPQPIPSNSIRPLCVGERVQILPEFQDPGDDEFERIVIEVPADSPRVLIRTLIPEMEIQPTETIEASQLVGFTTTSPPSNCRRHVPSACLWHGPVG